VTVEADCVTRFFEPCMNYRGGDAKMPLVTVYIKGTANAMPSFLLIPRDVSQNVLQKITCPFSNRECT